MTADRLLERVQRGALLWCLGAAAVTLVISPGSPRVAAAVLGGGLLTGISFVAIRSGTHAALRADGRPARPPRIAWLMIKIAGRYALLALLAYVMIARLSLSPVGLLVGASSVVAAAAIEAIRLLLNQER